MHTEELNDIVSFLESLKKQHYANYDDCWYSCPLVDPESEGACCNDAEKAKGECNCGADSFNAHLDEKIKELHLKHSNHEQRESDISGEPGRRETDSQEARFSPGELGESGERTINQGEEAQTPEKEKPVGNLSADRNFGIRPNTIKTFTGKSFSLLEMDPETITIEDIAHSLSMNCRWGGHTGAYYSVAEHSWRVFNLVPEEYRLDALMHDASEAYILDMPKPFKEMMPEYQAIEDRLMRVIAEKFAFTYPVPYAVKIVDKQMLEAEWQWFKIGKEPPRTLTPEEAKRMFLDAFRACRKPKYPIQYIGEEQ